MSKESIAATVELTDNKTDQEIQDFLDNCVDLGAAPVEAVMGTSQRYKYQYQANSFWDYFGVNTKGETILSSNISNFISGRDVVRLINKTRDKIE